MKHCQFNLSGLDLDRQEIFLSMGYGSGIPDAEILLSIDKVYKDIDRICKPRYVYEIYDGNICDDVSIEISHQKFKTGKKITHYLEGMEKCCVFATTAGQEYETYKQQLRVRDEILEEFIADAIGSVIAEACVNKVSEELAKTAGYILTYPYSPGYCNWKLIEQQQLFSLLPANPCGITLTDSCLMLPIKSISGIIGLGKDIKRTAYACSICDNVNCYKRKEV